MGFSLIALCCTMVVIIAFVLMALVEWLNGLLNHFHNKHTERCPDGHTEQNDDELTEQDDKEYDELYPFSN